MISLVTEVNSEKIVNSTQKHSKGLTEHDNKRGGDAGSPTRGCSALSASVLLDGGLTDHDPGRGHLDRRPPPPPPFGALETFTAAIK